WTRNPEIALMDACHELGVTLVAFSPVGRGFLAGGASDPSKFGEGDMRAAMPRFQGEALAANLKLLARFEALAAEVACTPAQLCLAWLMAKDPTLVSIPGTANPDHMRENAAAAAVALPADMVGRVDAAVNERTVTGSRYPAFMQASVDTERTPAEADA
ncbi:MAG TPA: aldo/keto reductase, partial [Phenylobacterium sp.]|nr:aldo/keto reductase [Phenylobacterium sp.]